MREGERRNSERGERESIGGYNRRGQCVVCAARRSIYRALLFCRGGWTLSRGRCSFPFRDSRCAMHRGENFVEKCRRQRWINDGGDGAGSAGEECFMIRDVKRSFEIFLRRCIAVIVGENFIG